LPAPVRRFGFKAEMATYIATRYGKPMTKENVGNLLVREIEQKVQSNQTAL